MKLSSLSLVKYALAAVLTLLFGTAYSQYPATGNKQRLGWQTTGDGLVYRGAIADTSTLDPSGLNNAWMLLDTASGNLYAYRIKAWRLVSGGGGGGLTMPFNSVTFNVNETDASEQELQYSADKGYLQYGGLDSVQIPLLPGIWYVRNDTSVTIPKGTVVRASGTLGASGRIKVKHMIANGSIPAMYVLGIAMQDIAVGADGYVMTQGKIRQVNTTAYSEGAVLYADVDTLGGLTQTKPGNGYLKLPIAFVVRSASNGTLAVRIDAGSSLHDLHDVDTTGRVNGSVLRYDSALKYWKASTTAGIVAGDTSAMLTNYINVADTAAMLTNYVNIADTAAMLTNYINVADTATMLSSYISNADTSVFVRQYQLSGTSGYLPKYTTDTTMGNSVIQESGGNIGISATPSAFKLDINGSTHTTGDFYADRASRSSSAGFVSAQTNNRWLAGMIANSGSWHVYDLLKSTSVMTLDSAASRVGIGTTSPNAPLTVIGASSFGGLSAISGRFSDNANSSLYISHSSISGPVYSANITSSDDLTFGQTITGGTTEYMRIKASTGRVGIGTTSPARSLHVSATDAVRIPAGSNTQRTPSGVTNAVGDLRYNTEDSVENIEWYDVTGTYRRPVISALPTGFGTAGRFAQFKAGGLDTSDVIRQVVNKIAIDTSAADSTLTVGGSAKIAEGIAAKHFRPLVSGPGARPNIGMWSNATNTLNFSTNDTSRVQISSTGAMTITTAVTGPTTPVNSLTLNRGITAQNAFVLTGDSLANSAPQITVLNQDVGQSGGYVVFQKRRGASGAVQDGDELGTFSWGARRSVNAAIYASAGFRAAVNGTVTSDFVPVDFTIFTSPNTDGAPNYVPVKTDRLTVKPGGNVGIGTASPTAKLHINGSLSRNAPVTVTDATHTVAETTSWLICNRAGTVTLTLPTASSWTGREIMVKTIQAQTVISAATNISPLDGGALTTAILPATDGAWATLVSDGTNWIIMQRGS